jgi:hypothetical protein
MQAKNQHSNHKLQNQCIVRAPAFGTRYALLSRRKSWRLFPCHPPQSSWDTGRQNRANRLASRRSLGSRRLSRPTKILQSRCMPSWSSTDVRSGTSSERCAAVLTNDMPRGLRKSLVVIEFAAAIHCVTTPPRGPLAVHYLISRGDGT